MKKNKMMRLASVLLVLTLLSTSVISGTFAKYTTQDSANDSARVAKWGVELQVVGNLYGDTYGASDKIVKQDNASGFSVQSSDTIADVVAPGTKNDDGFTFSLKGQPEVDGEVKTTMKVQNIFLQDGTYGIMIPVDVVTEANFDEFFDDVVTKTDSHKLYKAVTGGYEEATVWEENTKYYTLEDYVVVSDDYFPVVYDLTGNTSNNGDDTDDTTDTLKDAAIKIATAMGLENKTDATEYAEDKAKAITVYTGTKSFEQNTDLATWNVDGLKLTWAWAFGAADKVGDNADENDKADTILGYLMADKDNAITTSEVVKLSEGKYISPIEYTDYCLDTSFSIDITVTQKD